MNRLPVTFFCRDGAKTVERLCVRFDKICEKTLSDSATL